MSFECIFIFKILYLEVESIRKILGHRIVIHAPIRRVNKFSPVLTTFIALDLKVLYNV